jgi:hypothetical protein
MSVNELNVLKTVLYATERQLQCRLEEKPKTYIGL